LPAREARVVVGAVRAPRLRFSSPFPVHGLLATVLGLLAAGGCAKRESLVERAAREQVLHYGIGAEPQDLDPQFMQVNPHITVMMALYEGLVTYDPVDLRPVPGVAERWDISEDGLHYTFHLRRDAKWSNGDPVTAHDFIFSYRRILTPTLGSPYAYFLDVIRGAADFRAGRSSDFSTVGLSAPDDHTLRVELGQPAPFVLFLAGSFAWMPLHRATVEKTGPFDRPFSGWTKPGVLVGNGPFVLKEWRLGDKIIVERNPRYWGAAQVRLNAVHFHLIENEETEERAFRNGQLHATEFVPNAKLEAWRRAAPGQLRTGPFFSTYFYAFDTTKPPFDRREVRQAFSLALDREALVAAFPRNGMTPAHSFVVPGVEGYDYEGANALRFDPAEARRLLAAGGYPDGAGFPAVDITFNSASRHQRVAEVLQAMWERNLGVRLGLHNVEGKVYNAERIRKKYLFSRAGWVGDYLDPHSFLEVYLSTGGQNTTGFANPGYDGLLKTALGAREPAERRRLYRQAEDILLRELPLLPLFYDGKPHLVHPAVRGWHSNLLDLHPVKDIWLESPAN
jgi:oligopeptide transport system substrate-binding protein